MEYGFFGMAFDFDFNGHLDALESAADFAALMSIMDDWERQKTLEDAGLDPDDYDF